MSNRKLMGALSILLLAVLFMAIGCGDGKRNSHANTRKVNQGGKNTPAGPQKPGAPGQSAAVDDINKARKDAAESGENIPREQILPGTYSLSEVATHVSYQSGNEVLAAIRRANVVNNQLDNSDAGTQVGSMARDADEERQVEIPVKFTFDGANGALSTIGTNDVYKANVTYENKINHSLNTGSGEINVLAKIQDRASFDNSFKFYKSTLGRKTVEIRILKGQTLLRFSVTIREKEMPVAGNKKATLIKTMTVTYKLEAAPAATAPQGPPN